MEVISKLRVNLSVYFGHVASRFSCNVDFGANFHKSPRLRGDPPHVGLMSDRLWDAPPTSRGIQKRGGGADE